MIQFNNKLVKSDSVSVAVSMGLDSIAGSHFLSNSRSIQLIHVNHGTPMADLYEDGFVRYVEWLSASSRYSVTSSIGRGTPKSFSESDLRDVRYSAFTEAMTKIGNGCLVTCHHLNDCVESYLMNAFNGTPERVPIPSTTLWKEGESTFTVVRPFLRTSKDDFRQYAESKNIMNFVVEDDTNCDTSYKRNWLRNELIPMIESRYPGLKTVVRKKVETQAKK